MTKDDNMYQATMAFTRMLLNKGLLSESEYNNANALFTASYLPSYGILFSDIELLKQEPNCKIRHSQGDNSIAYD